MNIRRIEAGIFDSGSDFDSYITPFEVGLGKFIDLEKSGFIGYSALQSADREKPFYGLICRQETPLRGAGVFEGQTRVGTVTTGAYSPYLDAGIRYVRFEKGAMWSMVLLAFALRWFVIPDLGKRRLDALDGFTSRGLTIIVIGLMSAVGPALERDPFWVLQWIVIVMIANLGSQCVVFFYFKKTGLLRRGSFLFDGCWEPEFCAVFDRITGNHYRRLADLSVILSGTYVYNSDCDAEYLSLRVYANG